MNDLISAAASVPLVVWAAILLLGIVVWFAYEIGTAPLDDEIPRCESCGAFAERMLDDGSVWCASCDEGDAYRPLTDQERRDRISACAREWGGKR